ncbi:snaclec coagulation factor X-activating enzyme light chain 1-like [Microplitis mediator]|uniref:snaclec coagulation factor X-activating enzyme light chain 1-like n=1 Tax=Microplitis mediator TaxID=375433 RepID=UPI0025524E70|nr:snaclec coagulation factor X-activating enzyme light chain 1-like [Microplitis mediator]
MKLFCLFIFSVVITISKTQSLDWTDSEPDQPTFETPPGYNSWGTNLYKAYNVAKNWNYAQQTCQEDNGNLAVINSAEEAQFVRQLLIDNVPIIRSTYPGGWVGFRDFDGNANWQTLTRQNLDEAGYNKWWRNGDKDEKDKCGAIKTCGRFSAVSCDESLAFICEIEPLLTNIHVE